MRHEKTSAATRAVDGLDLVQQDHVRREALAAGIVAVRVQAGEPADVGGIGAVVRTSPDVPPDARVLLEDSNLAASVGLSRNNQAKDPFSRFSGLDKLIDQIESGQSYSEDLIEYAEKMVEYEKELAEKDEELEKDFKKAKKAREKAIEKAEEKGKEHKEKRYKGPKKPRKPRFDADKESFARVASGELPLIVQAHRAGELRDLLKMTERFGSLRLMIAGGTEALAVAPEIAERGVGVIVWPSPLGTNTPDEWTGHDLSLAGRLAKHGVRVLIGSGGRGAATRELPLLAGVAVGHGLERAAAFEALTMDAARALDLGDRLGSVEHGKDADLLLLSGEPLMTTTRVLAVISAGRLVQEPQN